MKPRRAAIITISLEALHQALGLPDDVELQGISGLRLNENPSLVLIHPALPQQLELAEPDELSLEEVRRLVASHPMDSSRAEAPRG